MEKELYNNFSNERIIIKPVSESLGRGIKLYDNIGDFINYSKKNINLPNKMIVQECIDPYLITNLNEIENINTDFFLNKKFDMRLYVFLSSNKNFYISDHSFCRFSALKYDLNNKNLKATVLTNTSINKNITNNTNNLILPIKDWNKYYEFKPIIENYCGKIFENLYKANFNNYINLNDQKFITLLGFDVMISADNEVKFIEVNRRPNLSFLNNTQKKLKVDMCKDYLDFIYQEINKTTKLKTIKF